MHTSVFTCDVMCPRFTAAINTERPGPTICYTGHLLLGVVQLEAVLRILRHLLNSTDSQNFWLLMLDHLVTTIRAQLTFFCICFHATCILKSFYLFFFFRFVLSELTTADCPFLFFRRCGAINHQPIVHVWFLSVICALVALLTDLQTTHMGETGSTLHLAFFLS